MAELQCIPFEDGAFNLRLLNVKELRMIEFDLSQNNFRTTISYKLTQCVQVLSSVL